MISIIRVQYWCGLLAVMISIVPSKLFAHCLAVFVSMTMLEITTTTTTLQTTAVLKHGRGQQQNVKIEEVI